LTLHQNSPNPFGALTRIDFAMPGGAGQANLEIYNVRGQVVRAIEIGAGPAATGSVTWDGTDGAGRPVASGVYFYKLSVDGESAIRSMVLLK
jgi:flagellar hook assembly protein FlgD